MSSFLEEKDYSEKIDYSIWRKLAGYMKPHKKIVILLCINMALVALVDIAFPLFGEYAIDVIIAENKVSHLPWFAIAFITLAVAQGFFIRAFIRNAGKLEAHTAHDIRKAAFEWLQRLSFSFFDKTPVGYLMARLTSDVTRLGETIGWSLVDVMWSVVFLIAITTMMLIKNWKLALIVLVVIPPLALISLYFQKKILTQQRLVRKTNSRITRAFNEGIMGAKTSKTLVREEQNQAEFSELTQTMYKASVRSQVFSTLFWPFVMTLGAVATGVALWQGGNMVLLRTLELGTLSVFINYAGQFFEPVMNLARTFAEMQSSQASAERVIALIDTPLDIVEKPEAVEKYGTMLHPKREAWPEIKGDIEFQNVSFYYNELEEVLNDFSLTVKAGQTVALVGETGSGKSTIVNLLCRFYEPRVGNILIDGMEYRDGTQYWLQSNLGYVLQSPHLFSGSVRDNIRYGRMEATQEEVEAAAKLVNAHGFIEKLDGGYSFDVGEGGNKLSTGEKQLVSFARAVLKNPRIFVLDEATSSVDTETEYIIQDAISRLLEGRTSFIIAHRLSTIRKADIILVIRSGKVIEQGTHRQLMKLRGYYYNLYTNQFMEERQWSLINE